ncbi:hypothetical protein C1645_825899 [Glomus cerebriforme]|uniref:Zn(2)-C6 fungal-type domain-containing protein n=1 Tax=Glomus cerebriforme TaxID=658196 RepID=A0A397SHQ5_9GLOM|nr:hypothetical protein C1645_832651 [Glomus cerebriforme]RIA88758.1 hypothetical protein C1645_825899 [Glomus cerebriforme]
MSSVQSLPVHQPTKRQPRGSINRRACQKCRHLKIKCDGDAENNVSCSNCDYGTCVYDKSPRKNRQVEKLNSKIENLENLLVETQSNIEIIQNDFIKKTEEYNCNVEILKWEKQISNLLFDCNNFFADHPIVFNQLRQAINESRCWAILLPVINALLSRLSQDDNNSTNSIIATLRTIAEASMNYCNPDDAFNPSATIPQNLFDEINISNQLNTTITTTESVPTTMTTGMANLALHSPGSDIGSDMSNLSVPDFKLDITSPLLTPTPNIEVSSPHLTPPMEEISYYSGSEYGSSPVHTSNDFTFNQHSYMEDGIYSSFPFYGTYGSNSSNSGQ